MGRGGSGRGGSGGGWGGRGRGASADELAGVAVVVETEVDRRERWTPGRIIVFAMKSRTCVDPCAPFPPVEVIAAADGEAFIGLGGVTATSPALLCRLQGFDKV